MKKIVISLLSFILICCFVFVSCNSEITEDTNANVVFAPSSSKALNQSGDSLGTDSESVDNYHWKYICSTNKDDLSNDDNFKDFYDNAETTGLGTIKGLSKGESYYFALKGYEPGAGGELMWAGCTEEATMLKSKTTLVTISVNPCGRGYLFFELSAPVYIENADYPDKFKISWTMIGDDNTTGSDYVTAVLSSDSDVYTYSTVGKDSKRLEAGSYLFTIQQYVYNEGSDETDKYEPVKTRKQVLIVNIQSGVNTIIGGSLDSTALSTFSYYANTSGTDYGIEIIKWIDGNSSDVDLLAVKALSNSGEEKVVYKYDTILVSNGDYSVLDFSAATTDCDIYVNGDKVYYLSETDIVTDEDLNTAFYKKNYDSSDSEAYKYSLLRDYSSENKTIKAYGRISPR